LLEDAHAPILKTPNPQPHHPPGGVSASHLDIAPRHAGLVFGVGNTAATLAGLVAIPATGFVLHHTGSWAVAFAIAALHNVVGAAVWAAWAGGSRLPEDGGTIRRTPPALLTAGAPLAVSAGGGAPVAGPGGGAPAGGGLTAVPPLGGQQRAAQSDAVIAQILASRGDKKTA
jgi:hypothetical protein